MAVSSNLPGRLAAVREKLPSNGSARGPRGPELFDEDVEGDRRRLLLLLLDRDLVLERPLLDLRDS